MKKLISLALVLVLALSLLPVPAGAKTTYTYKPYTYTDEYGDIYTFSAASTGYDLHFTIVDEQRYHNIVILKPGSTVTAKKGQGGDGFITYAVGDGSIGDVVGGEGKYGTWAVEKIYDYHVNSFGYERDNVAAALSKDNIATFFIMEGTAEAHSDMITLAGAEAPKFAPKMDVSIRFEDDGYEVDNGHVYHYTLSNNTDAPIQRYAALVSYLPNLVKVPEFDEATRTFVIKENAQQVFHGQIHAIDIDLAADESVTMPIISNFYGLSALSILWIDFESLSERDEFLKDPIFYGISTPDIQGYRAIDMLTGAAWMKATLGITINPAK